MRPLKKKKKNIPFTIGPALLVANNGTDSSDWVAHVDAKLLGTMV